MEMSALMIPIVAIVCSVVILPAAVMGFVATRKYLDIKEKSLDIERERISLEREKLELIKAEDMKLLEDTARIPAP